MPGCLEKHKPGNKIEIAMRIKHILSYHTNRPCGILSQGRLSFVLAVNFLNNSRQVIRELFLRGLAASRVAEVVDGLSFSITYKSIPLKCKQ